uniref:Tf2-1-like SH3-like domain-containing protein n=1 Tax=Cajanus cajan TaxID=3821 RepID=A0A151SJT9_CAJCA|nr:hypothetical protein KK1_001311 [Cajanus cajan]
MKSLADQKRKDHTFEVGDWVLLRLQPYRQVSLHRRSNQKLARRFYGLFRVHRRIGAVAYELELPLSSKLHPVFHISRLRPYIGNAPSLHHQPLSPDSVLLRRDETLITTSDVQTPPSGTSPPFPIPLRDQDFYETPRDPSRSVPHRFPFIKEKFPLPLPAAPLDHSRTATINPSPTFSQSKTTSTVNPLTPTRDDVNHEAPSKLVPRGPLDGEVTNTNASETATSSSIRASHLVANPRFPSTDLADKVIFGPRSSDKRIKSAPIWSKDFIV